MEQWNKETQEKIEEFLDIAGPFCFVEEPMRLDFRPVLNRSIKYSQRDEEIADYEGSLPTSDMFILKVANQLSWATRPMIETLLNYEAELDKKEALANSRERLAYPANHNLRNRIASLCKRFMLVEYAFQVPAQIAEKIGAQKDVTWHVYTLTSAGANKYRSKLNLHENLPVYDARAFSKDVSSIFAILLGAQGLVEMITSTTPSKVKYQYRIPLSPKVTVKLPYVVSYEDTIGRINKEKNPSARGELPPCRLIIEGLTFYHSVYAETPENRLLSVQNRLESLLNALSVSNKKKITYLLIPTDDRDAIEDLTKLIYRKDPQMLPLVLFTTSSLLIGHSLGLFPDEIRSIMLQAEMRDDEVIIKQAQNFYFLYPQA